MTNRSSGTNGKATVPTRGTSTQTKALDATRTTGPTDITQLVPSACSDSLAKSLRRSRHGWRTPAPTRPSSRARTCRMSPTSRGDRITIAVTWTAARTISLSAQAAGPSERMAIAVTWTAARTTAPAFTG